MRTESGFGNWTEMERSGTESGNGDGNMNVGIRRERELKTHSRSPLFTVVGSVIDIIMQSVPYRLTLLRMISGARYSGVPHRVQVRPRTRFAKPKSVTCEQIENRWRKSPRNTCSASSYIRAIYNDYPIPENDVLAVVFIIVSQGARVTLCIAGCLSVGSSVCYAHSPYASRSLPISKQWRKIEVTIAITSKFCIAPLQHGKGALNKENPGLNKYKR